MALLVFRRVAEVGRDWRLADIGRKGREPIWVLGGLEGLAGASADGPHTP